MSTYKFYKDSAIYVAGTFLSGGLGYAFHFAVSRLMPVSEYGELQSLVSLFNIAGIFSAAVLYFVIKYSSVFAKNLDYSATGQFLITVRKSLTKWAGFFLLGFLLASPLFYHFLHLESWWGLFIFIFSSFIGLIAVVYSGVLSGWGKFFEINVSGVVGSLIKFIVGIILVIFLPSAPSAAMAFLLSAIVSWIVVERYCGRFNFFSSISVAGENWQKRYFPQIDIRKSLVPIFIFSALVTFIGNIDVILVKCFTSAELTGYYSALSLLGKIIFWVNSAIIAVVLPSACANGCEGRGLSRRMFWGAYGLLAGFSIISTVIYFFFPGLIISLLFGSRYVIFMRELWLFGVLALAMSFLIFEANLAYARHDFRISYILGIVAALMASGVSLYHQSITQVAMAIIGSLAVGYIFALILNFRRHQRPILEVNTEILNK
ncbi:MAG: hypothetical protein PHD51_03145 [Patescibacteria group bacterium]|nr:hypothetical protein [Patescibacteria group bacterium]MDD5491021.1 hypothetical protein [Patescibacteria group bacterium]